MIENQRITGRMGFRNRSNGVFHLSSIVLILILAGGLLSACAAPLPDSTPLPQPTLTNTLSALPTTPPTVTTTPAAETPTLPIITSTIEPLLVMPPGASLTVNGQTQTAGIGAYCWTTTTGDAVTTACAKLDGVPTAREPLVIVEAATFNRTLPT